MVAEDNKVEKKSDGKGGIKSFIAGGCGGVCVVLSGHPFDTIKVSDLDSIYIMKNFCSFDLFLRLLQALT